MTANEIKPKRILLVDDNAEIHRDFIKIFAENTATEVDEDEAILFGVTPSREENIYKIDSALQGQEALELVRKSLMRGEPYALAFIDMRMPPGWDGIETIKQIWAIDSYIQIVICTAYSDHSWKEITRELGYSDSLLILKKPFEVIEINQMASALTRKWELVSNLHGLVKNRTRELENSYSLTHTTIESIQESILAVSLTGGIVTYNKNFLKQWGITEELLKSEKLNVIFQDMAKNLEDSVHFFKTMIDVVSKPKIIDVKEWQLKTGTLLELYAQPQYLHDEIIGIVMSFRDITERKKLENQLVHQATHDALTGLPNRALLHDRINQELTHAKRYDTHFAILLIDLDGFKEINDTLGHKAGDALLKSLAKRLSGFIRSNDTVARLGGDEFVVILASQANEKNIVWFLSQFIELFLSPCQIDGHEIIVTASIGVSIYPRDGQDDNTLLKNADVALYHAKDLGRNRYQFYLEEFNKEILLQAEVKAALSHALEKQEFFLQYQPLVDLKSNNIIGLEALLRWQHPTLGFISPMTFIPIAEETGQILAIGEWVLRTACTQTQSWHQLPNFPKIKISINISARQFRQKDFVPRIRKILKDTQLDPKYLELEITEGLILSNTADVIKKMLELKTIGVRFAIDDFGTGYSTLSYLKYFPFDTVKIDKMFIDNIYRDTNNATIVEAIINMTKHMGIDVLAEGVEKEEQVTFLRQHHGNQVQGYYYSKPLPLDECTKLLKKNK